MNILTDEFPVGQREPKEEVFRSRKNRGVQKLKLETAFHQRRFASVIKRANKVDKEKRQDVSHKQLENQGSVNLA